MNVYIEEVVYPKGSVSLLSCNFRKIVTIFSVHSHAPSFGAADKDLILGPETRTRNGVEKWTQADSFSGKSAVLHSSTSRELPISHICRLLQEASSERRLNWLTASSTQLTVHRTHNIHPDPSIVVHYGIWSVTCNWKTEYRTRSICAKVGFLLPSVMQECGSCDSSVARGWSFNFKLPLRICDRLSYFSAITSVVAILLRFKSSLPYLKAKSLYPEVITYFRQRRASLFASFKTIPLYFLLVAELEVVLDV
jgi:hypothetical protein